MKRDRRVLMNTALLAFIASTALYGQTQYDAARLIDTDLNGTARFVGMGGAMSALGGDISTIATNPAGIGIFRSNDFSTSFSFTDTKTEGVMTGFERDANRRRMSFDQLGIVFSNKFGNKTSVRYVNYAINYHKQRNFSKSMAIYGDLFGASQTDQIAWMTNHDVDGSEYPLPLNDYNEIYNNLDGYYYGEDWKDVSWLSVLGIQGGLVGPEIETDKNGQPILDNEGNTKYTGYYLGIPAYEGEFRSKETGGVNAFDFNISANINERVYLGATLGFTDVNYNRSSFYTEWGSLNDIDTDYTLENGFKTEGSGVNLKLGVIWRPIESSAFRVGAAIHTPTYYKLTDKYWASLYSYVDDMKYNGSTETAVLDYELITPWKFNLSLGHTLGTSVAIGAEYEYTDYSAATLQYSDGFEMENENQIIDEDLKGMHTLRLGVEAKLIPQLSLRAGYNFSSAAFEKSAYKYLYPNDMRTDTEYENMLQRNTFTFGVGYRSSSFYTDIAYKLATQKSTFYPFDTTEASADMKCERSQIMLTLGCRF